MSVILAKEFLTVQDVARLFSVSTRTVWRWIANGRLPAPLRLSEATIRWRRDDLNEHVLSVLRRTVSPTRKRG